MRIGMKLIVAGTLLFLIAHIAGSILSDRIRMMRTICVPKCEPYLVSHLNGSQCVCDMSRKVVE